MEGEEEWVGRVHMRGGMEAEGEKGQERSGSTESGKSKKVWS